MSKRDDKTEAPTPKRKKDARKKGQVAYSQELAPWITTLVGTYVLPIILGSVRGSVVSAMRKLQNAEHLGDPRTALELFGSSLQTAIFGILPMLFAIGAGGAVAHLAQTRGSISFHPLKPDFKRLNPIAGVKRLFSPKKLWTTIQQVAKAGVIIAVALPKAKSLVNSLIARLGQPVLASIGHAGGAALSLVRSVCWAAVAMAGVDYVVQARRFRKDLKMSKQEVKDEMKHSEGNPHTKGRIRQIQGTMARQRMMKDVPLANVIVTNPTHIAVALRYDPKVSPAPQVVAIGTGAIAAKIRGLAGEHGVPVVEAKPLARALWRSCQVGDQVPMALYEAVARVLVFVRRLSGSLSKGVTLELPSAYRTDDKVLEAVQRVRRTRRMRARAAAPALAGA